MENLVEILLQMFKTASVSQREFSLYIFQSSKVRFKFFNRHKKVGVKIYDLNGQNALKL